MTDNQDPSPKSEKAATVIGHVLGWPALLLGLGAWGVAVVPFMIWKAQGEHLLKIDQSLVGFGVVIYAVLSGIGVALLAAASGIRSRLTLILLWAYVILLVFGVIIASAK